MLFPITGGRLYPYSSIKSLIGFRRRIFVQMSTRTGGEASVRRCGGCQRGCESGDFALGDIEKALPIAPG